MEVLLNFSSKIINELFHDFLIKVSKEIMVHFINKNCQNPDIILVDYNSLDIQLLNRYPNSKLVMLDTGLKKEQLISCLALFKLAGIISVDTDKDLFIKALKVINDGQVWLDNKILKNFIGSLGANNNKNCNIITEQEKKIIQFVCQGLSNKEIAVKLNISEQTIKTHLNRVYRKLNVNNRTQLVSLCKEIDLKL